MESFILPRAGLAAALLASATIAQFVHPGVLNSRQELEFAKQKVAAGAQPWKTAFDRLKASGSGSLSYQPGPRATISCGSGGSNDQGCGKETQDSHAAYAHALLWAVGGDERHAQKCVQILDAYANTVVTHSGSNAPLQIGWTGGGFVRAAEILRYTYPQWTASQIARFSKMMNGAYLAVIRPWNKPTFNGNWDAAMIEVMFSIAVFDDNRPLFDETVARYKKRLPAYIYVSADGPEPLKPDPSMTRNIWTHWYDQRTLFDGLSQETCRDLRHVQHGLGSLIQSAEIAWKQGVDLYAERNNRLLVSMEFHGKFVLGAPVPSNLCGGSLNSKEHNPAWEIGYNHYVGRRKLPAPQTEAIVKRFTPEGNIQHMAWGTLSHHGTASDGVTSIASRPAAASAAHVRGLPGLFPWGAVGEPWKLVNTLGRVQLFRR